MSFFIAATTLALLLISIQKNQQIDSKFNAWWAALLWLSLATIGPALWPDAALLSFAVIPVLYSIWLFKRKNDLMLDQFQFGH